jgi:hypothetical protein
MYAKTRNETSKNALFMLDLQVFREISFEIPV